MFKVHAMNVIFLLVFVLVVVDFDLLLQHLQQQQITHTTMTISATAPAIPPIMPPFLKINKHSVILICNRGRRGFFVNNSHFLKIFGSFCFINAIRD